MSFVRLVDFEAREGWRRRGSKKRGAHTDLASPRLRLASASASSGRSLSVCLSVCFRRFRMHIHNMHMQAAWVIHHSQTNGEAACTCAWRPNPTLVYFHVVSCLVISITRAYIHTDMQLSTVQRPEVWREKERRGDTERRERDLASDSRGRACRVSPHRARGADRERNARAADCCKKTPWLSPLRSGISRCQSSLERTSRCPSSRR